MTNFRNLRRLQPTNTQDRSLEVFCIYMSLKVSKAIHRYVLQYLPRNEVARTRSYAELHRGWTVAGNSSDWKRQ